MTMAIQDNPVERLPLKVLICGAFGTGKTTLVTEVLIANNRGCLVPDVARGCPYPVNRDQTLPVSLWLLGEQIKSESATLARGQVPFVICDRGVPDILSHTLALISVSPSPLSDVFVELSKAWARTYDLVFWAKRDSSRFIEPDEMRLSDPDYQQQMENLLAEALTMLSLHFEVLPSGQDERVALLRRRILSCMYARESPAHR
jgi:predicted ATPase